MENPPFWELEDISFVEIHASPDRQGNNFMAGISPAIFFVIIFLIIIAATGRDVPTSGYSLNNMECLTGFHGKSLSGKKSKK